MNGRNGLFYGWSALLGGGVFAVVFLSLWALGFGRPPASPQAAAPTVTAAAPPSNTAPVSEAAPTVQATGTLPPRRATLTPVSPLAVNLAVAAPAGEVYVLYQGEVTYQAAPEGCRGLHVAGQVLDAYNRPVVGLTVNVRRVDTGANIQAVTGAAQGTWPNGFVMQLEDAPRTTSGLYAVQVRGAQGEPLSPEYPINTIGHCGSNLLTLVFVPNPNPPTPTPVPSPTLPPAFTFDGTLPDVAASFEAWFIPAPRHLSGYLVYYGPEAVVAGQAQVRGYDYSPYPCGGSLMSPADLGKIFWVRLVPESTLHYAPNTMPVKYGSYSRWVGPCLSADASARVDFYPNIITRQEAVEVSEMALRVLGVDYAIVGKTLGEVWVGDCPPTDETSQAQPYFTDPSVIAFDFADPKAEHPYYYSAYPAQRYPVACPVPPLVWPTAAAQVSPTPDPFSPTPIPPVGWPTPFVWPTP